MSERSPRSSTWTPLGHPLFRALWLATLASNLGTWIQGVGAAWLMVTLTSSATLIALVQAANSLPLFLLSLPAGALADVVDRRRLLLVTQTWMLTAATLLALLTWFGRLGPGGLLALLFLLGLGAALNQPAWQAIVPELVPRDDLPAAIALGSVGFNLARAVGPALGGLVVSLAGPAATFLLNAVSFLGVVVVLYRWRRPGIESVLPAERVWGAMRTGLRYVRHAPEVASVIVRGSVFVLFASSLWALLPVVARDEIGRGAVGYGLLLAALGLGAVAAAMLLPRLGRRDSAAPLVGIATLVFAGGTLALATLHQFWLLAVALFFAGGAWLALLSSLNVAIQTVVPSWVRARALSVYMLAFFGGLAGGSALWGAVAERRGFRFALLVATGGLLVGLVTTARYRVRSGEGMDLAPSRQWPAPIVHHEVEPERGPVVVTVEYRVPTERESEFAVAMADLRRIRLRDGALEWGLFQDAAEPARRVELFLVKSWAEHLRQHERSTFADQTIEDRARTFQLDGAASPIRHLIAERVARTRWSAPRRGTAGRRREPE